MAEKCAGMNRLASRRRPCGVHEFGATHAGRKRKAAGQRLAETNQIRNDIEMLAREPFSGAAKAGVNLIENQQRAIVVAQFSEHRQKFRRRNVDAAARLDRLNENGANPSAAEEIADLKFRRREVGRFFRKPNEIAELAKLRLER